MTAAAGGEPSVTAIVSTWSAERFMAGCLDDLLAQSLGAALEILVVDACSPQREGEIVRAYQQHHHNIRYLRTPTRENSSQAFNRAIALARGRYLTIANTDDRHHPEFARILQAALDTQPQVALVYADSLITEQPHETFAHNSASRRYAWPDFTMTTALSTCPFGAQPMWRKAVHAAVGGFDERLARVNDLDMFTRIAAHAGAAHIAADLGLFLARPDSVTGADNRADTVRETLQVMRRLRTSLSLEAIFTALPRYAHDPAALAAALVEMGNVCALSPYTDAMLALDFYRRAVAVALPEAAARARQHAVFANNTACVLACAGETKRALAALRLAHDLPEAAHNRALLASPTPPRLQACAFASLPHAVIEQSRASYALHWDGQRVTRGVTRSRLPWDVFEGPNGVSVAAPTTPQPATATAPHVLVVMYGWHEPGGGTVLPRQVALQRAARGARTSVFFACADDRPDLPAYSLLRGRDGEVEWFGLCNRPSRFMDATAPRREIDDPQVRARFAEVLDELAPDVVHFFNLHNLGMSLAELAKARGLRTLFTAGNYWSICPRLYLADVHLARCSGPSADGSKCVACLGQGNADEFAARRAAGVRMLNQHIDTVLAPSRRVRELLLAQGIAPDRVQVVPQRMPVVDALWRDTGSQRAVVTELRRKLRVAYVGSLLPHKGVHVLVQALQELPPGQVECVALGEADARYAAYLKQLDRRSALHLVGAFAPQDLPRYLALVDVVVVPSVTDDCGPMVVGEALAARCPVLGSRLGGIPDFVADGENGMLFTPGDHLDLARCLAAFAYDPGLLGAMQSAIGPPPGFADYLAALEQAHMSDAAVAAVAG